MSGIAPNPLNAISKVYLDQIAKAKAMRENEGIKTEEKDPFGRPGGKYGGVGKPGGGYDRAWKANQKKLNPPKKLTNLWQSSGSVSIWGMGLSKGSQLETGRGMIP